MFQPEREPFDRAARQAGRSKYSQVLGSMKIAFNGIVAFSGKPLRLATLFGFLMAGLSLFLAVHFIVLKLVFEREMMPGFATIIVCLTFFAGIQLICLGLMGEYISRIYDEVRNRPKYIVARRENFPEDA